MEIRELRCAVTVADAGSFSKAARELLVSRQAIAKTIRGIEAQTGLRLFEQVGQHLAPTEAGVDFLERARAVVALYDETIAPYLVVSSQTTDGVHRHKPENIAFALVNGGTVGLPEGFFERMTFAHPTATLSVEEMSSDAVLEAVGNGNADLGLIGTHPELVGALEARCIRRSGIWLLVPPGHPLELHERVPLQALDGLQLVTAGPHNHLHRFMLQRCKDAGVHPVIAATSTDGSMIVQLTRSLGALCFGFDPRVRPVPEGLRAVALEVEGGEQFGTYALRRPGSARSSLARAVWDELGIYGADSAPRA